MSEATWINGLLTETVEVKDGASETGTLGSPLNTPLGSQQITDQDNFFDAAQDYRILTRYGNPSEVVLGNYLAGGVSDVEFSLSSCDDSRSDYYGSVAVENGRLKLESNSVGHVHGASTQTETVCTVTAVAGGVTQTQEFRLYTVSDRTPQPLPSGALSVTAARQDELDLQITLPEGSTGYVRLGWRAAGGQPQFAVASGVNSDTVLTLVGLQAETAYDIRAYLMTAQAFDLYRASNTGPSGTLIAEGNPDSKWISNLAGAGLGKSTSLSQETVPAPAPTPEPLPPQPPEATLSPSPRPTPDDDDDDDDGIDTPTPTDNDGTDSDGIDTPTPTDNDGTDSDGIDTTGQLTDNDGTDSDGIDTTGQLTDNDGTDSDGIDTTGQLTDNDGTDSDGIDTTGQLTDNDGTDSDGIDTTGQLTDNDGTDSDGIDTTGQLTDNDGTDSDGIDTTGQLTDNDGTDSDGIYTPTPTDNDGTDSDGIDTPSPVTPSTPTPETPPTPTPETPPTPTPETPPTPESGSGSDDSGSS